MVQLTFGKERGFGQDVGEMTPRCLMAAKFRGPHDPSGENTLAHWVAMGQIQDSLSLDSL